LHVLIKDYLLQLLRGSDMDVLGPYPEDSCWGARQFDVLISDVSPEDLSGSISTLLGAQYLGDMQVRQGPVKGIVYNTKDIKMRVLFALPVSARCKSVATHFILDTGAPHTYISQAVLNALAVPEVSIPSEVLKVNGVKMVVGVSDSTTALYNEGGAVVQRQCHFAGLNILGMDFLDRAEGDLRIVMGDNAAYLTSRRFVSSQ
jgi:hypothetical protein